MLLLEATAWVWLAYFATHEQQAFYAAPIGQGGSFLGHTPLYQPHHWLVYTLRPNYRSLSSRVRHNSYGFRGPEFSVEKPLGMYRIVALGGSTTYGIPITDDAKTYPARLEGHLKARYPGLRIEVINAGVGGYTSAENLINLVFKVLDLTPDLLIIYHAHNDVHPRRQPEFAGDYTGYRKVWCPSPLARDVLFGWSALARIAGIRLGIWQPESIYKYTTTLTEQRPKGEEYMENFRRSSSRYFRRNLRAMVAIAKGAGIEVLLPTAAYFPAAEPAGPYREVYERATNEHNQVGREVAAETGVEVFDFGVVMPAERRYFTDSVHLTEEGADLQGRLFADRIIELGYIDQWARKSSQRR
ncbi:MAG: SGNH/GDSL hydrolase family protein [Candidatus Rokubacteria bacterium]|nr:SGNH/GDSL hydrolase family protein [Candidatus Rokubacteria bacterium]